MNPALLILIVPACVTFGYLIACAFVANDREREREAFRRQMAQFPPLPTRDASGRFASRKDERTWLMQDANARAGR